MNIGDLEFDELVELFGDPRYGLMATNADPGTESIHFYLLMEYDPDYDPLMFD